MKISVLLFSFFFLCNNNLYATEKNNNSYNGKTSKPKINKNTQKRIEYGCKRPNWGNVKKNIKLKYANIKGIMIDNYNSNDLFEIEECIFSTRHFVLFDTSKVEPVIEVKKCNNKLCCYVEKGKWEVFDGKKNVIIEDPKELQIDHILPFSYIRLNMKDCKLTNQYFNFIDNLKPELASVNSNKSDKICENKTECELQKSICKKMSKELDDKNLCEEINKIKF